MEPIMWIPLVILLFFICVRILHRLYYLIIGHIHHPLDYSPRQDFEKLLQKHHVKISVHEVKGNDGVTLRYRRMGQGRTTFYLANGVGTDFFMWLPAFRHLLELWPSLFEENTFIVANYRGLFEPNDDKFHEEKVSITIKGCVEDITTILKHAEISQIEGLIGWSTGAQVGLELAAKYPKAVKKLFLLNPSCGNTLHTALQPFYPLPFSFGKMISKYMTEFVSYLKTLIPMPLWNKLKRINDSINFYMALSAFAFFGGFPPAQPAFFHEYMKDTFKTRSQTRALLDLILSLDEPMSSECFSLQHHTTILSGSPDFLTGVYHSHRLVKCLPNTRHVNFRMGSHFLLIEWPDHVARELHLFLKR